MPKSIGNAQAASVQEVDSCDPPEEDLWDIEPPSRLNLRLKRALDIAVAVVSLIILAPLIATIFFRLKNEEGGVLFKQVRIGKNGKPFFIYKFRTMTPDTDTQRDRMTSVLSCGRIFKVRNDPRVTSFGRFLRKHDLDEIPQFVNVLKGDMSLVGPRPPLAEEVALYKERDRLRLAILPGITGLWQVAGNRQWVFEQMIDLDIQYARNWSLLLDLKILLKTPLVMLRGRTFDV